MRDNRIRNLELADQLGHTYRRRGIFVFKSDGAVAVYLFGKRIYASPAWRTPKPMRPYYKKYSERLYTILREPTEAELAGLLPAFHTLKKSGGKPMTVGDYLDFTRNAWKAKQVSELIKLLMEVEK